MLGLIVAGIFGGQPTTSDARTSLDIIAPVARVGQNSPEVHLDIPILFITIACGAISGFHCLVSAEQPQNKLVQKKMLNSLALGQC